MGYFRLDLDAQLVISCLDSHWLGVGLPQSDLYLVVEQMLKVNLRSPILDIVKSV